MGCTAKRKWYGVMKRRCFILSFLCILIFSIIISPTNASAKGSSQNYLRVITTATPFYADFDGQNLLFYLPYTYYVKVLSLGETLSHVECYGDNDTPAIDGYAPTEMLFSDGLEVDNPYPHLTIKTAVATVLYSDAKLSNAIQHVFADRQLTFYGKLDRDEKEPVYYVGYNNKLGYVSESDILPFTLPEHKNPLTFLAPDTSKPAEPETSNDGALSLRIIIIACLGLAGGFALIIALKKKPKTETAISYYDENDYE